MAIPEADEKMMLRALMKFHELEMTVCPGDLSSLEGPPGSPERELLDYIKKNFVLDAVYFHLLVEPAGREKLYDMLKGFSRGQEILSLIDGLTDTELFSWLKRMRQPKSPSWERSEQCLFGERPPRKGPSLLPQIIGSTQGSQSFLYLGDEAASKSPDFLRQRELTSRKLGPLRLINDGEAASPSPPAKP